MQRVVKRGHARFWTITRIRRADNQNTVKVNWTTFNGFAFRFLVSSNQVMKWILICNDEHEYYTKNGKVTTLIFFNCGCNVYRFNFVWRRFFENWDNTRNKWRPIRKIIRTRFVLMLKKGAGVISWQHWFLISVVSRKYFFL